jgi:hypothetical protein
VLVIDGKNSSDVGRFKGRVCMARTTAKTQKSELKKLRRNNAKLHAECKCAPGPRLIPLPKLKRDSVLRCTDEIPYIKARRRGEQISAFRSECMDQQLLDPKESARDKF